MSTKPPFLHNSPLQRFLASLPEDVADSFSREQLEAIQGALQSTQWQRHPVDIRLTIPLLWKKFYFVLVIGPERRPDERRKLERLRYPLWTPINLLLTLGFVSFGIFLFLGLTTLTEMVAEYRSVPHPEFYPASIPFKENQTACEQSGRTWEGGECMDFIHDPTF